MKKLLVLILVILASAAKAEITVSDVWVKPTTEGQSVSGAYMKITSDKPVKLVSVSTKFASAVEIHEMKMDGDIMRMRQIAELPIPSDTAVELKPGGLHLMLVGVSKMIDLGSIVSMNLNFVLQDGSKKTITVQAKVKKTFLDPQTESHHKH